MMYQYYFNDYALNSDSEAFIVAKSHIRKQLSDNTEHFSTVRKANTYNNDCGHLKPSDESPIHLTEETG